MYAIQLHLKSVGENGDVKEETWPLVQEGTAKKPQWWRAKEGTMGTQFASVVEAAQAYGDLQSDIMDINVRQSDKMGYLMQSIYNEQPRAGYPAVLTLSLKITKSVMVTTEIESVVLGQPDQPQH